MKKDIVNNVVSAIPFISAAVLEDTLQILMLVLGSLSFLISVIYSGIKTWLLLKNGKIEEALNELEHIKKEMEEIKK